MQKQSRLTAILFILLFPLMSKAQPEVEVEESSYKFNGDKRSALAVTIHGEEEKEVEKKARKTFRGWGNVKSRSNPLKVEGAEWKDMGDHPFDFYLGVEEEDDRTQRVYVAAYLGGAWLNSNDHGDRYEAMKERLYEFAVRVTKEAMDVIIEKEEDKLDEMTDELEDLTDNIEDLQDDIGDHEDDIEDYKKAIKDAEKAIKKAQKDVEDLKGKVEEQKGKVEEQQKAVEKAEEKKDAVD